jgi:hypothetical protein
MPSSRRGLFFSAKKLCHDRSGISSLFFYEPTTITLVLGLVQRVLHRFGRLDALRASGQLDTLVQSLGRFAEKIVVLDAHAKGETTPTQTVTVGPGLIFDRLWRECGIQAVLQAELTARRFDFDGERAILLTVVHRLMAPGSDRAVER